MSDPTDTPAIPTALRRVTADLVAEGDDLDALVSQPDVDFSLPTPAVGWTIAHQIGHLHWIDELALEATTAPTTFLARRPALVANLQDALDSTAAAAVGVPASELLESWRAGRTRVVEALRAVPPGTRLEWIGPPMGAGTMASARLMETWAHGQDIGDALGVRRDPTDRLRHVVELGVRTRDYAFRINGQPLPAAPFRFEIAAPSGVVWTWGPDDAPECITGSAADFALLITRRRHPDDLDVRASGPLGQQWISMAQVFVGSPGPGREPAKP
jgi:uncharacterized protein (TIGR03084 family)